MDSKIGLVFNRFGEEIEKQYNDTKVTSFQQILDERDETFRLWVEEKLSNKPDVFTEDQLNKKLQEVSSELTPVLKKVMDEISKLTAKTDALEKIKNSFGFSKNYVSLRERRLVSVSPGVDANDCITKIQLDKFIKDYESKMNDLKTILPSVNTVVADLQNNQKDITEKLHKLIPQVDKELADIKQYIEQEKTKKAKHALQKSKSMAAISELGKQ